jgi:hypothetical protein
VSSVKKSGAVAQRYAEPLQMIMAGQLHRQITGEAVRALYDDRPHAIAGDAVQHGSKARALRNRIRAPHSLVVEPFDDLVAGRPRFCKFSLARPSIALR